jgi:hypothetical protein
MPFEYIRNEDGDFICPHCPNVVISGNKQSTMHYHLKRHEIQKAAEDNKCQGYTCKGCNKIFLQKQNLELHIKSRHPELLETDFKDTSKYYCPFDNCEFSSITKGNCIIHCLRVHYQKEISELMCVNPKTKAIECNECNTEFNSSTSFYYHCKRCMTFEENEKYEKLQQVL